MDEVAMLEDHVADRFLEEVGVAQVVVASTTGQIDDRIWGGIRITGPGDHCRESDEGTFRLGAILQDHHVTAFDVSIRICFQSPRRVCNALGGLEVGDLASHRQGGRRGDGCCGCRGDGRCGRNGGGLSDRGRACRR